MKTALKILGALLVLLVVAAVAVPFMVDVNKYRPQIVAAVNERINGKFDLGNLKLSLWGRVKVNIDGLTLSDSKGKRVVTVKDASVNIPLLPFITGSPVVSLVLNEPAITLVKNRDGKINALSLMKDVSSSTQSSAPQTAATKTDTPAASAPLLPPIVLGARVTMLIEHAKLSYVDELTSSHYDVSDFSFHVRDVSPTSKMPFDLEAMLDVTMNKTMVVKGALRAEGSVKATGGERAFDRLEAQLSVILDNLDIQSPGALSKRKGVPLRLDVTASTSKDGAEIPVMKLQLAEVIIDGKASAKTTGSITQAEAQLKSNQVDLAKLGALFPVIEQNGVNGIVQLSARVSGPTDRLGYGADIKFDSVAVKSAAMAETLTLSGAIEVATNELKALTVNMAAPSLVDGKLTGSLSDFSAPRFRFAFQAKDVDLDKFMITSAPSTAAASTNTADGTTGKASSVTTGGVDYNAYLDPLRKNPLAAKAAGTFDFNIARFKSAGVILKTLKGQLAIDTLLMQLKGLTFQVFDGGFKMDASINARAPKPVVAIKTEIVGMKTERMVESHMTFAKNTVSGVVSGKVDIGGTGLNRPEINTSWRGGGAFNIKDAKFSSLDMGRQIKSGLIDKLPDFLKSKVKVSDKLVDWKGEYSDLSAKFALVNGTLTLSDLDGKAVPQRGLDLKGGGTVSISDYKTDLSTDFIDRYEMIGNLPKDKKYGVPAVSAKMGGSLFEPKFDWGYTLSQLAKNAMQDTVKEKASSAVKEQLNKVGVPDAAKNLFKKFF